MENFIKSKNNVVLNKDNQLYKKVIFERSRKEIIDKIEKDILDIKDALKIIHECLNEERFDKIEKDINKIKNEIGLIDLLE